MKNNVFLKLFFLSSALFLLLFLYISTSNKDYLRERNNVKRSKVFLEKINEFRDRSVARKETEDLKYILQWTSSKTVPFVYMKEGRKGFIDRNCTYTNCFVTSNVYHLGLDYTKFDVIVFAGPEVVSMPKETLPKRRSAHQKYVFASIESGENYPVCSNNLDNFFNWTWTYRLDSDAKWGYIVVRDSENKIVGPKADMHWMKRENMLPTTDEVKKKTRKKTKAAAWFVSNCYSRSHREHYAIKLMREMNKFNLKLDIFGGCGSLKCSRDNEEECNKMIERDYYFYLSFENSFSQDYVTEKLLYPLQNLAVPIVYGGANYSRFVPDGIYLNARELDPKQLVEEMVQLIKNPEKYEEYFRWRNHYSYHRKSESVETDDYCGFCAILNDEDAVQRPTIYKNFRYWWDPPDQEATILHSPVKPTPLTICRGNSFLVRASRSFNSLCKELNLDPYTTKSTKFRSDYNKRFFSE